MALGLNVDCRSDEGIAGRDRARRHRQLTRRISERTETKQRRRTLGHTRHRAFAVGGEVVVIFGAEVVSYFALKNPVSTGLSVGGSGFGLV